MSTPGRRRSPAAFALPRAACALALVVGCRDPARTANGSATATAARPTPAGAVAPGAQAAAWRECTEATRAPMEALLLERHALEKADDRIDGLRCVTLQLADAPAFLVELVADRDGDRHRFLGVVALDGMTERVPLREVNLHWSQVRGGQVSFETIDLDGDHADEVVVHYDDRRQQLASWIDVVAIRGTELSELKGPRISFHDPDLDERCEGELTREKVGGAVHLVVTTVASTGASDHCLDRGRHVFALEAGRLVLVVDRHAARGMPRVRE